MTSEVLHVPYDTVLQHIKSRSSLFSYEWISLFTSTWMQSLTHSSTHFETVRVSAILEVVSITLVRGVTNDVREVIGHMAFSYATQMKGYVEGPKYEYSDRYSILLTCSI